MFKDNTLVQQKMPSKFLLV